MGSDREDELIDRIAKYIVKLGFETPATLYLTISIPLAYIQGQIGLFFLSPFLKNLAPSIGVDSDEFMLLFQKRENYEKIIDRIEMYRKQRDGSMQESESRQDKKTMFQRLRETLFGRRG